MSIRAQMLDYMRDRPDDGPEVLAAAFLKATTKAALVPMVADEFIRLRRMETARLEYNVIAESHHGPAAEGSRRRSVVTLATVRHNLGCLADILDEPYRIGDGREYKARDMPLDAWKTRLAMLEAKRDGLNRAIELCRMAIGKIESAGVETLRDIEEMAAVPLAA